MQIGPKIRIGGSIGKAGQKLKMAAGSAMRNPLVLGAAGLLTGGTAPLLMGLAGGALKEKAGVGDVLMGGIKGYTAGKVGGGLKSGLSAIKDHGLGTMVKGSAGMVKDAVTDPSRFRSVASGLTGGGEGGTLRTLMDVGKAGEGIYDRYLENQDRKMAEAEYRKLQPLRDQGMAGLMDTSRPDVSSIFAEPQTRYRPVNVGSRGRI